MLEILLNGVPQRTSRVQAAERSFESGEALDRYRFVGLPFWSAANEGRYGSGDRGDGAYTARNFLDIDTGVGWRDRHDYFSELNVGPGGSADWRQLTINSRVLCLIRLMRALYFGRVRSACTT